MKARILEGESIELTNQEDHVILFKGHNGKFCFMLNGKVIKTTQTWGPIQKKLGEIGNLVESK